MMRTFSLFTTDTRYTVPTLTLILAEDEARAITLAQGNLAESEFHTHVELREGDRCVCKLLKAKVPPPHTESYFADRAARADVPAALAVLERAGRDRSPLPGDEVAPDTRPPSPVRRESAPFVADEVVLKPATDGPVALWDGQPRRTASEHDSVTDEP